MDTFCFSVALAHEADKRLWDLRVAAQRALNLIRLQLNLGVRRM